MFKPTNSFYLLLYLSFFNETTHSVHIRTLVIICNSKVNSPFHFSWHNVCSGALQAQKEYCHAWHRDVFTETRCHKTTTLSMCINPSAVAQLPLWWQVCYKQGEVLDRTGFESRWGRIKWRCWWCIWPCLISDCGLPWGVTWTDTSTTH